jgi:hypothetical protein
MNSEELERLEAACRDLLMLLDSKQYNIFQWRELLHWHLRQIEAVIAEILLHEQQGQSTTAATSSSVSETRRSECTTSLEWSSWC